LKQKKLRALDALSKHAGCKLASYFHHWSNVEAHIKQKVSKNLKEIITRLLKGKVHRAFNLWKNGKNFLVNQQ